MYTHTGVSLNSFLFRRYFQKWNFTQNEHPHRSFVNFQTGCKLLTLIDLPFQVCLLLDQHLVFVFFCSFIWLCVNCNNCNWLQLQRAPIKFGRFIKLNNINVKVLYKQANRACGSSAHGQTDSQLNILTWRNPSGWPAQPGLMCFSVCKGQERDVE